MLCECGCGKECKKNYVHGHNRKGISHSDDHRKKISIAHIGMKLSEENREKAIKNLRPHIKGEFHHSAEAKRLISEKGKGKSSWNKGLKGSQIPWNQGIKCPKISRSKLGHTVTPEARQKISNALMGHIPWNKGIKYTEEQRLKYAVRWDADYIARVIPKVWASAQRKPNKLEKKAEALFKSIDSRCRYVGNGKMWISGRNPDFIIEGTNKLIEVFGSYWHEEDDEEFRKSHFKSCGFNTLVIWDKEFQDPQFLREKVRAFVS